MSRGILSGGDFVLGGILSRGILSGGFCPGGFCPGGFCPRTIKNMSERDWKSILKSSVHREALLQLQVELSMNRKTSHLTYNKLCTKDYLKQLPPSLAKVVFMAKTRMLDIKTNYKSKYYKNLKCPFCCVLDESFGHLFTCRFGD